MNPLLTGKELAALLGMPLSTFHKHRKAGAFRHLVSQRPVGIRKYARVLVESWLAAQPIKLVRRAS